MLGILCVPVALGAIVVAYWSPFWAWVVFAVPEAIISFTLVGVKAKSWKHIPELSESANDMLQKYGHFYTMPFAAKDFSSTASIYQLCSIVLGVICGLKGAWWGVAVAFPNMILMAYVARAFNPTVFIVEPLERLAHEEVLAFVMARSKVK